MTTKIKKTQKRIKILEFGSLLIVCSFIAGCPNIFQPNGDGTGVAPQPQQNQCQQLGLLSCITPSASSGLFCCQNMFNANASVGYLCVLGRDQFAGCYDSLEQARQSGCTGTVVRCTR